MTGDTFVFCLVVSALVIVPIWAAAACLSRIVSELISIANRLSYRQGSDLYFLIRDLREWLERERMKDKLR